LGLHRDTHPLLLKADEKATEYKVRNITAYCLTSSAIAAANITYLLYKKHLSNVCFSYIYKENKENA
jgi:hypothetical protein